MFYLFHSGSTSEGNNFNQKQHHQQIWDRLGQCGWWWRRDFIPPQRHTHTQYLYVCRQTDFVVYLWQQSYEKWQGVKQFLADYETYFKHWNNAAVLHVPELYTYPAQNHSNTATLHWRMYEKCVFFQLNTSLLFKTKNLPMFYHLVLQGWFNFLFDTYYTNWEIFKTPICVIEISPISSMILWYM